MSMTQTSTIIIDGGGAGGGRILGGGAGVAAAAVPAAAVKAKNRFPLTIAPLWSPRRDRGAIGPRRHLSRAGICVLSEPPVSRFCLRVHPS